MVASIGAVASPSQGASYYERDGYYAKDDPDHRAASAWAGTGAEELGLKGPVDPDTFKKILEGRVPDGPHLGKPGKDGEIHHRPGRDLTFSAPKSVSLAALIGGDVRIVDAHDRAVGRALDWFERNAAETRMKDPETGRMVRTGDQKTVIATFRHDTSRNLDPVLHTHSVIANMLHGADGKWRTMPNESLYGSKMLLGALYRSELAGGLAKLGYGIEKTHADGRFEIAGVSRQIVEAFSTRRAEIEAAMQGRGLGGTAENQHLEERRIAGVDHGKRIVHLEGPGGTTVDWKPSEIGGRKGGTEVYRSETIELRAGDRIRWTRNDAGLGLVNSGAAEIAGIRNGRVVFRLEDGRRLELDGYDPQLRHLDHAWCSTVHAFQGRTVDNVIAAMEANHPHLTTAKSFFVEISRARDRAELVTDDAAALRERLEAVTGERISALEGIGEAVQREHGKDGKAPLHRDRSDREVSAPSSPDKEIGRELPQHKAPEPEPPAREKRIDMDLGL